MWKSRGKESEGIGRRGEPKERTVWKNRGVEKDRRDSWERRDKVGDELGREGEKQRGSHGMGKTQKKRQGETCRAGSIWKETE